MRRSGRDREIHVDKELQKRLQRSLDITKRTARDLVRACLQELGPVMAEMIAKYGAVYIPHLGLFWIRRAKPMGALRLDGVSEVLLVRFRGTDAWRIQMKKHYKRYHKGDANEQQSPSS